MKLDLSRVSLVAVGLSLPVALDACRSSQGEQQPANPAPAQQPNSGGAGDAAKSAAVPMAGGQTGGTQDFQSRAQEAELRAQRNAFLADQHCEKAEAFLTAGNLEEARLEAEAARALTPSSERVLRLRDRIATLMGGGARFVPQEVADAERLREQKTRVDIEESLSKAGELLGMKEYDRATAEVDHALDILRWSPYAANMTDAGDRARNLKNQIGAVRKAQTEEARRKAEADATERLRKQEAEARSKRSEVIRGKLQIARDAFRVNDFKAAREIADAVLYEDPRNAIALEIRDAARTAEDEKASEAYLRERKQRFAEMQIENLEARTLQSFSKPIELPSREFWDTISKLRDKKTSLDVVEAESEDTRIVREQLRSKMLPSVKLEGETDIEKIASFLHNATGLPFVVSPAAKEKVTAAGAAFNIELPHPIRIDSALTLILGGVADVTFVVRDGVVWITTTEAALGTPIARAHDVSDLIFGLTAFQGPRIYRLSVPGTKSKSGGPSDENPFGAAFDPVQQIPPEEITNLIKDTIAPGTWEQPGVHLDQYNGQLVVTHSIDVQRQVSRFLADLRRYTSSLVTIEARFVTISENFLQAIGVDFRGLPNQFDDLTNGLKDNASAGIDNNGPGLPANAGGAPSAGGFFDNGVDGSVLVRTENLFDQPLGSKLTENGGLALQFTLLKGDQASIILKAVEKNLDVHEVNAQILSVANAQRSYITVVNQQSYIADYDVEVAQASFIAEPKINILQSGVVLDVKPIINYNRKYITLELQPTVARVVALNDFTTTLGGLAGAVTFQLPQLAVQSAFTTAVVPDGGAVLIGGLKTLREVEARAEVPWLGRIPVLGFFFKKEGYDSENENLMILVRARIADAYEEIKKLESTR
ncbi:MAG: hypothetical protein JNJ88_08655 [Planctomycetes bacterium]|nr:hypothetical protein [Planctomycetota bacterium]